MFRVFVPMWAQYPRDENKPRIGSIPNLYTKKPEPHEDYLLIEVLYPGQIYFEREEDAHKAARYYTNARVVRVS